MDLTQLAAALSQALAGQQAVAQAPAANRYTGNKAKETQKDEAWKKTVTEQILDSAGNSQFFAQDMKSRVKLFAHAGFDYDVVLAQIEKYSSDDANTARAEIADMIIIGLQRGNLNAAGLAGLEPDGQARVKELADRYNLILLAKGEKMPISKELVTFTRVVAVFAVAAAHMLNKADLGVVPRKLNLVNGMDVAKLPPAMRFPGFAALLKPHLFSDDDENHMRTLLTGYGICFWYTMRKKGETLKHLDIPRIVDNIINLEDKNPIKDAELKVCLSSWGIAKDHGDKVQVLPSLVRLAEHWQPIIVALGKIQVSQ